MNQYDKVPKNDLIERAKELECLYLIDEVLIESLLPENLVKITSIIPLGFRNIHSCIVNIELDGQLYYKKPSISNGDELSTTIVVSKKLRGHIKVMYPKNTFPAGDIIFLDQEIRLLNTIGKRISEAIERSDSINQFYLLQCSSQSRNYDNAPVAIPPNIPRQSTIFTANKYITNGKITGIDTVIYINPVEYEKLESYEDIMNIRNIVSQLNRLLPRRNFILMVPGPWGSRGDMELRILIEYLDINNTAMLIEIAGEQSKYYPHLSFDTHLFQNLVEENIKYLPLYPEDNNIIFNHAFFRGSQNALEDILPMYSHLSNVVKVINIKDIYYRKELVILMNGELQKAIAYLQAPIKSNAYASIESMSIPTYDDNNEEGWKWRHYMAERIAKEINMETFSIKGIYLFGSTNDCTARLNSDIDLLIHFHGTEDQKKMLDKWLHGWSMALSEINYLKTGYRTDGLLDIHYITDEDIMAKTSYAIKIDSVFDPAFPLRIR